MLFFIWDRDRSKRFVCFTKKKNIFLHCMKNFITAILAFLYISTSTGTTVHMHYCMGKLADWSIIHNESKTCGKCGMEKQEGKDNGCCKDEHKFYKDDSAQKISESSMLIFQVLAISLPSSFIQIPEIEILSLTEENPLSHAPPRTDAVSVYIRNCTFLI